jgi:hypothetical protein
MAEDTSSGVRRLQDDNYHVWQMQMRSLLDVRGLNAPLDSDAASGSTKARGLIILSVSEKLQTMLASTKSAKEAWDRLKEMFDMQTTARISCVACT